MDNQDRNENQDCELCQGALFDYVSDALDPGRLARVQAHLRTCPECRARLQEICDMLRVLQDAPEPPLPKNFQQKLHARLLHTAEKIKAERKAGPLQKLGEWLGKALNIDYLKRLCRLGGWKVAAPALACVVILAAVFSTGLLRQWTDADKVLTTGPAATTPAADLPKPKTAPEVTQEPGIPETSETPEVSAAPSATSAPSAAPVPSAMPKATAEPKAPVVAQAPAASQSAVTAPAPTPAPQPETANAQASAPAVSATPEPAREETVPEEAPVSNDAAEKVPAPATAETEEEVQAAADAEAGILRARMGSGGGGGAASGFSLDAGENVKMAGTETENAAVYRVYTGGPEALMAAFRAETGLALESRKEEDGGYRLSREEWEKFSRYAQEQSILPHLVSGEPDAETVILFLERYED